MRRVSYLNCPSSCSALVAAWENCLVLTSLTATADAGWRHVLTLSSPYLAAPWPSQNDTGIMQYYYLSSPCRLRYVKHFPHHLMYNAVSYIRVYETSAECLRTTDPSPSMIQTFVRLQRSVTSQSIHSLDKIEMNMHIGTPRPRINDTKWRRSIPGQMCLICLYMPIPLQYCNKKSYLK